MNCRTLPSPWGNEDTQQLIDILGKYNIKVTFFVVGEWVDKYPESVKALSDAGHEVMNHSNDHAHFNSLSAEEIVANINACSDKIEAITGVRPTLFRPPYGEYDDHVISAVRGMGIEPIQWDVERLETNENCWGACGFRPIKRDRRRIVLFCGGPFLICQKRRKRKESENTGNLRVYSAAGSLMKRATQSVLANLNAS